MTMWYTPSDEAYVTQQVAKREADAVAPPETVAPAVDPEAERERLWQLVVQASK